MMTYVLQGSVTARLRRTLICNRCMISSDDGSILAKLWERVLWHLGLVKAQNLQIFVLVLV